MNELEILKKENEILKKCLTACLKVTKRYEQHHNKVKKEFKDLLKKAKKT